MMLLIGKWIILACAVQGYVNPELPAPPLDPCLLACQLENSVDVCKLVHSENKYCKNMYWANSTRTGLIVDIVHDEDDILVEIQELVDLLRAEKGGCEQVCKNHRECMYIGSSCKPNNTCLNLFWNRGVPVASQMTTCYESPGEGCYDAVPVLCGTYMDVRTTSAPVSEPEASVPSVPASAPSPPAIKKADKTQLTDGASPKSFATAGSGMIFVGICLLALAV